MLVSYILRLAPDALDEGRIAGEVHIVATGGRRLVRSGAELIELLLLNGSAVVTSSSGGDIEPPAMGRGSDVADTPRSYGRRTVQQPSSET